MAAEGACERADCQYQVQPFLKHFQYKFIIFSTIFSIETHQFQWTFSEQESTTAGLIFETDFGLVLTEFGLVSAQVSRKFGVTLVPKIL